MPSDQDSTAIPKALLNQGLLDDDGLAALMSDIKHLACLLTVRVKGGARSHSLAAGSGSDDDPTQRLDQAVAALRAGARGVQLRYRYDGDEWCDTLMPAPGGWRVVRMHQEPPSR